VKNHKEIISRVREVYEWIAGQLAVQAAPAGRCDACGRCCDFEAFDHKLFVTSPEMLFFAAMQPGQNLKQANAGRCPWLIDGKCSVYDYRFAGCRIFCCKGDADFQSRLSEAAAKKFKTVCDEFEIPYRYVELSAAMGELANPCQPADR